MYDARIVERYGKGFCTDGVEPPPHRETRDMDLKDAIDELLGSGGAMQAAEFMSRGAFLAPHVESALVQLVDQWPMGGPDDKWVIETFTAALLASLGD